MQFSINYAVTCYNVVAIRLVYICFLGLHGSHTNKLTSSSHTMATVPTTKRKLACTHDSSEEISIIQNSFIRHNPVLSAKHTNV